MDIGNEMNDDSSDDDDSPDSDDQIGGAGGSGHGMTPQGHKKKQGLRSLTPCSENIPVETTSEINISFANMH